MATSLKRSSILTTFASKRTQLWQYLNTSIDSFLRDIGLRTDSELIPGALFDNRCSLRKCENETITSDGQVFQVYELKGVQQQMTSTETAPGSGIYEIIEDFGTVNISVGPMLITENKSVVVADNSAAAGGGFEHSPIVSGAYVDNLTAGGTDQIEIMYLQQAEFGTVENQAISVQGLATFQAAGELYVCIKFMCQEEATVTIERL
tara:strand:- start:717 stop:1334 length:618 start_codon:yes stop_codon:yes gene_type:complete